MGKNTKPRPRTKKRKNPTDVVVDSARDLLDQMVKLGIPKDNAKESVAKHITPPLEDAAEILHEDSKKSKKKEEGW